MTQSRSVRRGAAILALAAVAPAALAEIDEYLPQSSDVKSRISPAGEVEWYTVWVDAGDAVTLELTSPRKAPLDFDVTLRAPSGDAVDLSGVPGRIDAGGRYLLPRFVADEDGPYRFEIGANAVGEFRMRLTVGEHGGRAVKIDRRPAALGMPGGRGETAAARSIPPSGGTLAVRRAGDRLEGAFVEAARGTFAEDAPLILESAASPALPDPSAQRAVGPAVRIESPVSDFLEPVSPGLPYRGGELPADADRDDILVLRVDDAGRSDVLTPVSVTGTVVNVVSDRPGTFVPFTRRGAPRMGGKSSFEAGFRVTFETDQGNDSRLRSIVGSRGTAVFADDGTVARTERRFGVSWECDDAGDAAIVSQPLADAGGASNWTLAAGGSHVDVAAGALAATRFAAADDASALVGDVAASEGTDPSVRFSVCLRRPDVPPTIEELAGTYLIGAVQAGPLAPEPGPAATVSSRVSGALKLGADGTFRGSGKGTSFVSFAGFRRKLPARFRVKGTWTIVESDTGAEFPGTVLLDTGTGLIRMYFDAGARRCVGVENPYPGSLQALMTLFVGVRKSGGARTAPSGGYAGTEFDFAADAYDVPDATVADVVAMACSHSLELDADRDCTLLAQGIKTVRRDPAAAGGRLVSATVLPAPLTDLAYRVARSGKARFTGPGTPPYVGVLDVDASFAFLLRNSTSPADFSGMAVLVRSAPRE